MQQLLGHWRQARQLSIHLRQGLLQAFVQTGVFGLYRCQSLIDHGLGLLQGNFNFGLSLVNHFVQRSAAFVQRRVDLHQRLIQQFTKTLARDFDLFAQGGQVGVQLVKLGLHRIGGRCQLGLGFFYQVMRLATHLFNFSLNGSQSLLRQAQHFVV